MPGVITQKTVTVPKRTDKGFGTSPLKSTEFMPTAEKPSVPGIMSQLKNTYKVCTIPVAPWCICMYGQHVSGAIQPTCDPLACRLCRLFPHCTSIK